MFKSFVLILFFILSCSAFAQQYPTIINLRGTPQTNGTVLLEFTVSQSTFTYSSYDLMRASDSTFGFASVYFSTAAIGGANAQDYSHSDPVPDQSKKYYYKVVFPNGSSSNTIVVDMGSVFGHYKIVYHPVVDDATSKVEFAYTQGQRWVMEVADPKGYFIYRIENITQNNVPINASSFGISGMYFFRLYPYDGSTVIKGKFVVLKQPQ
jgi:hypothetical protein